MIMRFFGFLCLASLVVLVGCSSRPAATDTAVTGKVTLDGVTLTMGEVIFENEDGSVSASGEIFADGTYRVASVPLGKVRAAVKTSTMAQYAGTPRKVGGKAITKGGREGTFLPVPARYESTRTSGLTFEVKPNVGIDIALNK